MRIYNEMKRRDTYFVQFIWVEDPSNSYPLWIWELFRLCSNGKYTKASAESNRESWYRNPKIGETIYGTNNSKT